MDLGFSAMNLADDIAPDVLARELEARGYRSVFVGEHTHVPVAPHIPYPTGGPMPEPYRRMLDPFITLALAASATRHLQIGTGVCLVLQHHVLDLAKTVATLDRVSGGRLLFGVGVGWNAAELANHRPDVGWGQRYRATAECVAALRRCWTDEESEFHGEFFDFDPVWSMPEPLQRPHPPVVVGAAGRIGVRHALRWADEWMPADLALGDVRRRISGFRSAAAELGREIPISLLAWGDPSPDTLRRYRDLGVVRTVVGAGRRDAADPSTTMAFLDRYAELVPELAARPQETV